jgi:hypothetical protein
MVGMVSMAAEGEYEIQNADQAGSDFCDGV